MHNDDTNIDPDLKEKEIRDAMPAGEAEDLASGESEDDETELPEDADDVEENMFPSAE